MISLKSTEEIEILRRAGKHLSSLMSELKRSLKSGITTDQIDQQAEELIKACGAKAAFKGYRGFPKSSCISVNQEVVHGIPCKRLIKDGDIVSIDVGIVVDGYYSDMAFSAGIGVIPPEKEKLLKVTEAALAVGIQMARPGNHLSDISHSIQRYVEAQQFSVVKDFVGHGIGRSLHEEPEIPNFGPPHQGPVLKEGMVLAIEPMVNIGGWQVKVLDDGWTVVTIDGKPSAHFEHTIAIFKNGPEILTKHDG